MRGGVLCIVFPIAILKDSKACHWGNAEGEHAPGQGGGTRARPISPDTGFKTQCPQIRAKGRNSQLITQTNTNNNLDFYRGGERRTEKRVIKAAILN